jgi:DnaJ family protein C protein 11
MAPLRVDDDFDGHDIFVNGPPHGVPSTTHYGGADADYTTLMAYPEEVDYYSLLGLSRSPPPTGAQIRSAYHNLTLSLHPDKQPPHLREAAEVQFLRVQEAYETLLDPKKRLVYDLLGAETVKREWSTSGVMGSAGPALDKEIGLKTTDLAEFRKWFLDNMKERERKTLDRLVGARVRTS